jgi:hypothetical protein
MNKGRLGEDKGSKEMDRCPLTLPPLQKHGVMTHEDCQEVARSALVKGMESKMAALIWHAAPGYLRWNCTIFGFACTCVSLKNRRVVPSVLMVVCIGMKCTHPVRLSTMHIIVLYPWNSSSSTMKSTLIVSHGVSGVSEGWSSPIGR